MAIALKMALFRRLCESGDVKPIIILDDVFAQLDEVRRAQILEFATAQDQVIITAAAERDIPTSSHVHLVDVAALREHSADDNTSDDPNMDIAALLGKRLENTV